MRAHSGLTWLLLALCGCAGYQLGPTNNQVAGARSVQVNPFENRTLEPRLSESLTHSLRKRLQQDGTFRLDTHQDGDIVVNGTIVKYDRTQLLGQKNDILTPREYRVTIVAHVTARQRDSGKVLLDRDVPGHTTVRVGADLTHAERQGLPLATEDLARSITSLLAEGSW